MPKKENDIVEYGLAAATNQQLWDELKSRTTGAVIIYDWLTKENNVEFFTTWYCSTSHALGLIQRALSLVHEQSDNEIRQINEGEKGLSNGSEEGR